MQRRPRLRSIYWRSTRECASGELFITWADYDRKSFIVTKSRTRRKLVTTKTNEAKRALIPEHVCKVINALPSRFGRVSHNRKVFISSYARWIDRQEDRELIGLQLHLRSPAAEPD